MLSFFGTSFTSVYSFIKNKCMKTSDLPTNPDDVFTSFSPPSDFKEKARACTRLCVCNGI